MKLLFLLLLPVNLLAQKDIKLIDFKSSKCNNDIPIEELNNKIIYDEISGDTLSLHIRLLANCGTKIHPQISFHRDTLNVLIDSTKEDYMLCESFCCFELALEIENIRKKAFVTTLQENSYKEKVVIEKVRD